MPKLPQLKHAPISIYYDEIVALSTHHARVFAAELVYVRARLFTATMGQVRREGGGGIQLEGEGTEAER